MKKLLLKTLPLIVTNRKTDKLEINNKLSKVLRKKVCSFIREIVQEIVEQIKEKLLGTVLRRLEILEGSVFEQKRDLENFQNDVLEKNKQIEELKSNKSAKLSQDTPVLRHWTT
ncbi:hypothetical protein DPMN_048618 [Dreissena polymorpha]|uniref:Uncharacterized protein n=1 Tax=Dreissena polymorpha TaxID=45954 RepID=A0A9D4DDQ4_DREPO|nr:hypothetical protein DPMN_048618 [Dreissena polymorpha]